MPFVITQKKNNLGESLTKHAQDLYAENYKTLMKELKENLNKETYCVYRSED